jgi:hypothetical protein
MSEMCPNCSSTRIEQRVGPDSQFVGAESPYRVCLQCNEQWEDADTFAARAAIWAEQHKLGRE